MLIKGCSSLSNAYISTLRHHRIEISVARRGCPWENGYAERLIRTLKEEYFHVNDYQDIQEASDRIGHFITQVYHQKRPHSALGYLTPLEFQRQNLSITLLNFGLNKRWHFRVSVGETKAIGNFTSELKAAVVLEALRGESSQAELFRRYNLSEDQLSKWKQQLVENAASLFASTD